MITIPTRHLRAALVGAGKHDKRAVLNSVLIECMPNETRCVASHGSIVVVLAHYGPNETQHRIVVPRDAVEVMVDTKQPTVTIESLDWGRWAAVFGTYVFTPASVEYPEYRDAFVSEVSGEPGLFDPGVFYAFAKAAKALGRNTEDVTLHQNGNNIAMVSIYGAPEFAGAIMPLNPNVPKAGRPGVAQWVRK